MSEVSYTPRGRGAYRASFADVKPSRWKDVI
jgi:hypothetical protein